MWCDSWPEAVAFTKAYRDNPDFPPDQRPSPAKYWREHSAAQIAGRFLHGLKTFATRSAKLAGYYKFVLFFALSGTVLSARRWPLAGGLIKRELFGASFCFVFFFCYILLYAWHDAVVTDSRFLPCAASAVSICRLEICAASRRRSLVSDHAPPFEFYRFGGRQPDLPRADRCRLQPFADRPPHKLICGLEFASDFVNPFRRSVSIERETPHHPIRTY